MPGQIAIKLNKHILKRISTNYKIILITGTNGKTSTTKITYNILKRYGFNTITNDTGANLLSGITTCFIKNYKIKDEKSEKWAVLEVDEQYMPIIVSNLNPSYILVTNLFRDQMDRNQECYLVFNKILESFKKSQKAKLILNGDCSILGNLDVKNYIQYYGFSKEIGFLEELKDSADFQFCKFCKEKYKYKSITYNCLGSFYCDNCSYKRQELKYKCNALENIKGAYKVKFNDDLFQLTKGDIFNVYNMLCAYSVASEIGIDSKTIESVLIEENQVFGRNQSIKIENKEISMILVKNPTSFNQNIKMICKDEENFDCCFIINDNPADSTDVSWLWDVDFEDMQNTKVKELYTAGIRTYDMALRLKIAFKNSKKININDSMNKLLDELIKSPSKKLYVISTYTAMFEFRKVLISRKYIKNMWT